MKPDGAKNCRINDFSVHESDSSAASSLCVILISNDKAFQKSKYKKQPFCYNLLVKQYFIDCCCKLTHLISNVIYDCIMHNIFYLESEMSRYTGLT